MDILNFLVHKIRDKRGFWGGVAVAAGSLLGSYLTSDSGRRAQEQANKITRELYYADREWNKPVNQVARLREAGLNPNLVYGSGGAVAGNTSKGAPKMDSIGGYDVDFAGAINAALTAGAIEKQDKETKNLEKQNQSLQEIIDKLKEERRGVKLDNDLKAHDLSVIKNTPTTSKDRSVGAQIVRGAHWLGSKIADKSSSNDFVRGASNLVVPQEMRRSTSSATYVRRPWFWKSVK